MLTVYGLKQCDTCRKAIAWLKDNAIAFSFHDVRADGLRKADVEAWQRHFGDDVLINRRGTTWRGLSDADRQKDSVSLILENPALFKRPVFVWPDGMQIGFTDAVKRDLQALAG